MASGPCRATCAALFRLAFAPAPGLLSLSLAAQHDSQAHSTKGTPPPSRAVTSCRSMVSGSLSLPSPGFFSPFPHGTMRYRWPSVFSLGSWSTRIRAGFLVPRPTQDTARRLRLSRTRLSRSTAGLPMPFRSPRLLTLAVLQPRSWRFGLLRFRSPLLTESLLISFPGLLRWFTSPSVAPHAYFIRRPRCGDRSPRVTPFGHPRIKGHVHLPGASRSLSRPSSPGSSLGIRHGPMFAWPYPPSRRTMAALGGYGYLLHRGTDSSMPPSSFFPSLVPVKDLSLFLWDGIELNYRPPPYQSGALTN